MSVIEKDASSHIRKMAKELKDKSLGGKGWEIPADFVKKNSAQEFGWPRNLLMKKFCFFALKNAKRNI